MKLLRPGNGRARPALVLVLAALTGAACLGSCFLAPDFSSLGRALALVVGSHPAFRNSSSWSPDSSRLLVAMGFFGTGNLYELALDGSDPQLLAEGPVIGASLSPDGKTILCEGWAVDETPDGGPRLTESELWIVSVGSSDRIPIAVSHGWMPFMPTWSPDGSWIACVIQEHLDLVRPDLSERRQLGPGTYPVWSPDGRVLASIVVDDRTRATWIQLIDVGTTLPVRLTPGTLPDWSPDGRGLAFADRNEADAPDDSDVFVIDADGANRVRVCAGSVPRWSPDGRRILVLQRTRDYESRLVTVAPDGSNERLLVEGASWGQWSPDGRHVAFVREFDMFVIDADGTNEHKVAGPELRAGA